VVQDLSPRVSIPELEIKIADFLRKQGFQVTGEAKMRGQSGIDHTFNLVAALDDGFADITVAININARATARPS